MDKHLLLQEIKWREVVKAKVKVYSQEEIRKYCEERGLTFAPEKSKT